MPGEERVQETMSRFSVLTLNMQNGQVWDPAAPDAAPIRIDRCVDFLRRSRAAFIFLQEVEYPFSERPEPDDHRFYDVLCRELHPLGYQSWFSLPGNTYAHIPFGIGLAVFSKFPILEGQEVRLPAADITFPYAARNWHAADRSLISVLVDAPWGRTRLLNTHLQAFFMIESLADKHPAPLEKVLSVIAGARAAGEPVILAGDFNCTPRENTIRRIEAAGLKTLQKKIITWRRMPFVLDHIFISPEFRLAKVRVVDSTISDHMPVFAYLET